MVHRPQDPRGRNIALGANALDPKDAASAALVDRFMALNEDGVFLKITPYGVLKELSHPSTPASVLLRSMAGVYSIEVTLAPGELARRELFRKALRGDALSDKHQADADHVFDADRNGANYFITEEHRILKAGEGALRDLLGPHIWIVSLATFFEIYDDFLASRR